MKELIANLEESRRGSLESRERSERLQRASRAEFKKMMREFKGISREALNAKTHGGLSFEEWLKYAFEVGFMNGVQHGGEE